MKSKPIIVRFVTSHAARRGLGLAAVLALIAACGDGPAPSTPAVRDSAGVRIVEHGRLPDRTAFEIGEPRFRVGWAPDGHQFVGIISGVLLEDGGAAVGDLETDELVYLSGEGDVVSVLGGSGEGPTEIGRLIDVVPLSGDTVLVEDRGNRRFSVFASGGFVGSDRRTEEPGLGGMSSLGRLGDGLVMMPTGFLPDIEEPWVTAPLVYHVPGSEQWDTLAIYDLAMSFTPGEDLNPLRPSGAATSTGEELLVVRGDRPEVRRLDATGRLVQIVRWDPEPRMLTDSMWNVYAERLRARTRNPDPQAMEADLLERREAVVEPLPPVGRLYADGEGRAWVSEYPMDFSHPPAFRVFAPDGAWLGWVRMPPRTEILDIGRERMLVVQRDPFDVEAVAVLPIVR